MTKKFLAVTLVLVLAAGFMAVAAEDEDRPLTGEWENTLTFAPNQTSWYYGPGEEIDNPFRFSSDLSVTYTMGGLTYTGEASFGYDMRKWQTYEYFQDNDYLESTPAGPPDEYYMWGYPYSVDNGLTDLEFGVETTVGLLDLSSTLNFDPTADFSAAGSGSSTTRALDYWVNQASLTLGGVTISDTFVLQPVMAGVDYTNKEYIDDPNSSPTPTTVTEDEYTSYYPTNTLGAGMNLEFSGETPGGVSVTVSNLFGMEQVKDLGSGYASFFTKTGLVSGATFGSGSIPYATGYNILVSHDGSVPNVTNDLDEMSVPDFSDDWNWDWEYGASSMQYVSTMVTLENLSLGCCDLSNETFFSEANGFEYTLFEFTVESSSMPISLDGDLMFTPQTKSIYLEPSLDADWACFEVYTGLTTGQSNDLLANNDEEYSVIDGFEIRGFAIKDVELGHVKLSSYTALGSHSLSSMTDTYFSSYDELIRIEKLEEYPLDFTLDTYFDMSDSEGIFDLAEFDGTMEYTIDDEFTLGTGIVIKPNAGLQTFDFTFDYSF